MTTWPAWSRSPYPRRVGIVDDLPKGPTGKVLKRQIEVPAPS
jgi:acyl-coenzyme A synthetase/AMP-(fatty) acid ligase